MNRSQKQAYKQEYADAKRTGKPFFPYAVYKDLIVGTIAIASVIAFAMIYRVEIGERVNPASTDFVPRPEWYFFFLFELLKIFKGQNAFTPVIMATFIIPNIMMALLILWPFLDPGPERRPHRRPIAMFVALGTIGFMGWLTFLASEAPGGTASAEDIQLSGLTPEAEAGLDLYLASGCTSCHMIQGIGAAGPGPDLTNEGAEEPRRPVADRPSEEPAIEEPGIEHAGVHQLHRSGVPGARHVPERARDRVPVADRSRAPMHGRTASPTGRADGAPRRTWAGPRARANGPQRVAERPGRPRSTPPDRRHPRSRRGARLALKGS